MSNVVDSKVVELSLDNSNFEKNASTTISTVQSLQKALDFSVSGKNFDNINSSIKKVNFEPINKGLEGAKKGFSALEAVAFGAFANIGKKISDTFIGITTAIPKQIISGGKSRALNMEQAKFQIEGLGKAWKDVYADVDYAVSGTAYGLDVAAKAASQLIASGVEFGETFGATGNSPMAKALRGISGVAAMTNSSYEEISNIFTKVAGQGSIMGGELQQLAARGLNVSANLAEFINGVNSGSIQASDNVVKQIKKITSAVEVSEADIREWASDRKISFDIFAEAMDSAFGEHATKANETFSGSLSNIKAQLSKIGEIFASPLLSAGQKVFSNLYDVVKDIRIIIGNSSFVKAFENITDVVSTKLAGAFAKAHTALQKFINRDDTKKVDEAQQAFSKLFGKFDEKYGIINKMRKAFGLEEIAKDTKENTEKINKSFESVKDTVLATIRGDFGNGMARIQKLTEEGFDANTIQSYVNELWKLTGHDWSKLSDDIYAQVKAQEELTKSTESVSKANEQVRESMGPLDHLFSGLFNICLGVSSIISTVKEKFLDLGRAFSAGNFIEKVATKFDELSQSFALFTMTHAEDIGHIFDGVVAAVQLVVEWFGFVGKAIYSVVNGALKGFGVSLFDAIVWISNTVAGIRDWIAENKIIEGTLNFIANAVQTVTSSVKNLWKAFTNLPIVKSAIEGFGRAFSFLGDNFSAVTKKGGKVLENFWSMLRNGFKYSTDPKQLFSNIRNSFSYLWNQIKSSEVIRKFGEAFGTVKKAITGYFEDLGRNDDGSFNTFGKIQNGFERFRKKIAFSFKNFKEDFDFGKLFTTIGGAFKNLRKEISASGLFEGIRNGFSSAVSSVKSFIKALGDNADGTRNTFGKITDGIASATISLKNRITDAWNKAFDFFEKKNLGEFFSTTFTAIKNGFGDFFSDIPQFVSGLRRKFGLFLDQVTDLGGFKFSNAGAIWQAFKDTVLSYIDAFDLFYPIREAFSTVIGNIREMLYNLGNNDDGTRNWFGKLEDGIYEFEATAWKSLGTLKDGFSEFFKSIPSFITGLIPKFQEFKEKVKELGGIKFDNFGDIWQAFKDTVGQYFEDNDVFKPISDAFVKVKDDIKKRLKESGVDIDGIIAKIKEYKSIAGQIFESIKETIKSKLKSIGINVDDLGEKFKGVFDSLKESWSDFIKTGPIQSLLNLFGGREVQAAEADADKTGKTVEKTGGKFAEFFKSIKETFKESTFGKIAIKIGEFLGRIGQALLQIKPETIFKLVAAFAAFKIIKGVWNEIKGVVKDFSDAITGLWKSTANLRNAKANFINKAALIEIAAAVGIVAYCIYQLAKIDDLNKALESAGLLAVVLGSLVAAMAILNSPLLRGSGNYKGIGIAMLEISAAIGVIVLALEKLMSLGDVSGIQEYMFILGEALIGISVALGALSWLTGGGLGVAAVGIGLLSVVGSLYLAVEAINKLKEMTPTDAKQAGANFAEAIKGFIEEINGIKFDDVDFTGIQKFTDAISGAAMTAFFSGVGEFVVNVLPGTGEDRSLMQRFSDAADVLSSTIITWNEKMGEVPEVKTDGLKKFDELVQAITESAVTGQGIGLADFLTNILPFNGEDVSTPERFGAAVQVLIDCITTWNEKMGDVPEVKTDGLKNFDDLKDAVWKASSAGTNLAIAESVSNLLPFNGDGVSTPERFAKGVSVLSNCIRAWNTEMENVPEVKTDGLKNFDDLKDALWKASSAGTNLAIAESLSNMLLFNGDNQTTTERFAKGVKSVSDTIRAWNTEMENVPEVNTDGLTKFEDLKTAVTEASNSGVGVAIDSFITNIFTQQGGGTLSVENFREACGKLGGALKAWQENMDDVTVPDVPIESIRSLAQALEELPSTGIGEALAKNIFGASTTSDDVENFKTDIGKLGEALKSFTDSFKEINESQITSAVRIIRAFSSLGEQLMFLVGDTGLSAGMSNIDTFANSLSGDDGLGAKLRSFVENAPKDSDLTPITSGFETLVSATNKLTKLDLTEGDIYDTATVQTLRTNVTTLSGVAFAASAAGVMSGGIERFATAVDKLSSIKLSEGDLNDNGIINRISQNTGRLSALIGSLSGLSSDGAYKLRTAVGRITSIALTKGDIYLSSAVATLCQNVERLKGMLTGLSGVDPAGVTKFSSALSSLNNLKLPDISGKLDTSGIVKGASSAGRDISKGVASGIDVKPIVDALNKAIKSAISSADTSKSSEVGTKLGTSIATAALKTESQFKTSATKLGTSFGNAIAASISKTASAVSGAVSAIASGAVSAARRFSGSFHGIGLNFSLGLANGIAAGRSAAISAAIRVASDALAAAKAKLQEHSPSKATFEMGMFFDLGLANGIKRYSSRVANESESVASIAMDGLKEAVKLTSQMVLGDGMDQPVITPVVDLSEIQNGANMIGSIFDSARPDVTLGNLSAINLNTNMMRQRAENNDLLNAITSLESTLSGRSGDTYNINGITYDDGSNVSDAVRHLIRAVKVERRA